MAGIGTDKSDRVAQGHSLSFFARRTADSLEGQINAFYRYD